ncbi:response regulator [Desulfurobacterium sp.]
MEDTVLSRNDNLKLGNLEFHVQTEYYRSSGDVVTLIFKRGEVIKRIEKKLSVGESPDDAVKRQHTEVIHKLISATSKKNTKASEVTIDELILSADVADFFQLLVSQIFGRKDFLFAKIIDVSGKPVLEITRKPEKIDKEIVDAFIDSFIVEEKRFYHMGEDGLYLYGFKLKDGTMVIVGFEKEDSKELLEKVLYRAEKDIKPKCNNKTLSILIVEDVLFTRLVIRESFKLISKELKDFCFEEIDEAESLRDALSILNEKHFDIVITDIHLGDGLGIEVASFVKKKFPDTKVIALTMYPENYKENREIFDGFIAKPVTPQELKEKLLKILS